MFEVPTKSNTNNLWDRILPIGYTAIFRIAVITCSQETSKLDGLVFEVVIMKIRRVG